MTTLEKKLQAIALVLSTKNYKASDDIEDFTPDELSYFESESIIRFAVTPSGHMCFLSGRPGKSGMAATKIKALIYFLSAMNFTCEEDQNVLEALNALDSVP